MVIFVPVVFLGGLTGELFRELGITISYALLASLLVALTIIPMLASQFIRANKRGQRYTRKQLDKLNDLYRSALQWTLNHKSLIIGLVIVLLLGSSLVLLYLDVEFLPPMDQSMINVNIELPPGHTLADTNELVLQVEEALRTIPEVESIASLVGSWADDLLAAARGASINTAKLTVILKEKEQRTRSAAQIAEEMKAVLAPFTTARFEVIHDIVGASMGTKQAITLNISGPDFSLLTELTREIQQRLKATPGFGNIVSSLDKAQPELFFEVNPFRALSGGLTATHIALAMRDAVGGAETTTLQVGGRSLPVVLRPNYDPTTDFDAFTKHRIPSALDLGNGQSYVYFDRVTTLTETTSTLDIHHTDRVRAATITTALEGIGMRQALKLVDEVVADLNLPPGYAIEYGGSWEMIRESLDELFLALALSVILVYMVMAAQFEAFVHPLIIMLTVPLGAIGSFLGLAISGSRIGVPSMLGLIILVGVAVNNGIVLIDHINYLRRKESYSLTDSVIQGSANRLRAVLMTTLTTVLALLPLSLGIGSGAEVLKPLAVTFSSGLFISTLMTLFVIPTVYHLVEGGLAKGRARSEQQGGTINVVEN